MRVFKRSDLSESILQRTDGLTGIISREADFLSLLKRPGGNSVKVSIADPTAKAGRERGRGGEGEREKEKDKADGGRQKESEHQSSLKYICTLVPPRLRFTPFVHMRLAAESVSHCANLFTAVSPS